MILYLYQLEVYRMTIKVYEGPSTVNGAIIMLGVSALKRLKSGVVGTSKNTKTGPMIQVGAMLRDVHPVEAVRNGADEAICGGCPLRPVVHNKLKLTGDQVSKFPCYVKKYRKVAQWKAIKACKVDPDGALEAISGRSVRFGEYGNMSSVPREVLEPLLQAVSHHTLYEHDWRNLENQWLKEYSMASVHSEQERQEARDLGWRTFRTGDNPQDGEIFCPHYTNGIQCIDCNLCAGQKLKAKDIVIPSHM